LVGSEVTAKQLEDAVFTIGLKTAELAQRAGRIDNETAARIKEMLKNG